MSAEKKQDALLKKLIDENPSKVVDLLLERLFWLSELNTTELYRRNSDDTDGSDKGIRVAFGQDGDAFVHLFSFNYSHEGDSQFDDGNHRFRSILGGGRSPRVRTALMILARAIELDNQEYPDCRPR